MPTARPFDWDLWARTNSETELRREARKQEKLQKARELANVLCLRFLEIDPELKKVTLFGSVARQDSRSEEFDIDLVVEGARRFGALFGEAEASDRPVDLLEWESLKERIRENIVREGIVLYEKP